MKWLFAGLTALLALFLLAIAVVPSFIDWNNYRDAIAAELRKVTGVPVAISGNIDVTLLPVPEISIGAIEAGQPIAGVEALNIRWLRARLKLADLLTGRATITRLTLIEPDLAVAPDGFSDLIRSLESGAASLANSDSATAPKEAGFRSRVQTQNLEVRGARVLILADGEQTGPALTEITGTIEIPRIGRRVAGDVSIQVDGVPMALDFRTVRFWQGESGAISFRLVEEQQKARLAFSGSVNLDGEETGPAALTGSIDLSVRNPMGADGWFKPEWLGGFSAADSVTLTSDLIAQLDGSDVTFENLLVDGSGGSAQGGLRITKLSAGDRRSAELLLRFNRLNLDAVLDPSLDPATNPDETTQNDVNSSPGDTASDQIETEPSTDWRQALRDLDWDLSLGLTGSGVRYRGALMRSVELRAALEGGSLTVEELSLLLPGSTDFSLAGFGNILADEPFMEGNITLRADDLRRLMTWLDLPVPDVAGDRLRRFSMVSGITFAGNRLDVIDAALELDGVTGSASIAVIPAARPGVGLRLTIDRINLDAYRPIAVSPERTSLSNPARGSVVGDAVAETETQDGTGDRSDRFWRSFDASLLIQARTVTAYGLPFQQVEIGASLEQGILQIRSGQFSDTGGVSGVASGEIDLGGQAQRQGELSFQGESEDLGTLSASLDLPDSVTAYLRALGSSTVEARLSLGDLPVFSLSASGENAAQTGFRMTRLPDVGGWLIDQARYNADEVDLIGGQATLIFDQAGASLRDAKARLNGGVLNLNGDFKRNAGQDNQLAGTLSLTGFSTGFELGDLGGGIGSGSVLDITGEFSASGPNWRAMKIANQGRFEVAGEMQLLLGSDRAGLFRLAQIVRLREDLRRDFGIEKGQITGVVTLENGRFQTDGFSVTGGLGRLTVSSAVDWQLNSIAGVVEYERRGPAPLNQVLTDQLEISGRIDLPNLKLSGSTLRRQ